MITTLSIADSSNRPFVTLPMDAGAGKGSPRVCISLKAAGDMWGAGIGVQNRRKLLAEIGVDEGRVRAVRQVHSKRVLLVDDAPSAKTRLGEESEDGDGIVSADPAAVLSVRVADCYPIFLFDRRSGAFAALHSGWRGTGISVDALTIMEERYGSRAEDILALIGPGIGACCYDVPAERAKLFEERFGQESVIEGNGRWYLDLARANIQLLEKGGVGRITLISDCTSCSPHLGSFRRQGPDAFTHMLALIGYFG